MTTLCVVLHISCVPYVTTLCAVPYVPHNSVSELQYDITTKPMMPSNEMKIKTIFLVISIFIIATIINNNLLVMALTGMHIVSYSFILFVFPSVQPLYAAYNIYILLDYTEIKTVSLSCAMPLK